MKKILIASGNPGKIAEIKIGLQKLISFGIDILTLNDVKVGENKPEENGKTFKDNALIKATFYAVQTRLPVVSDDGGLIIPYLKNEPGVKSRRWLGYDASDEELINHALYNLRGCTGSERIAYLETAICFYNPQINKIIFETEKISGHISEVPFSKRTTGYPFRAVFIVDKYNKYYDELNKEEHQQVNHRLKALKRLTKKIRNLI